MVRTEACTKKPCGANARHKARRNGKARRSGEADMAFQRWKPHGCLAWSWNGHRCRFTCPYNTGEQTTPSQTRARRCQALQSPKHGPRYEFRRRSSGADENRAKFSAQSGMPASNPVVQGQTNCQMPAPGSQPDAVTMAAGSGVVSFAVFLRAPVFVFGFQML